MCFKYLFEINLAKEFTGFIVQIKFKNFKLMVIRESKLVFLALPGLPLVNQFRFRVVVTHKTGFEVEELFSLMKNSGLSKDYRFPGMTEGGKVKRVSEDYKLFANYETMFSDTRARLQIKPLEKFSPPEQLRKTSVKSTEELKQMMEVQGCQRTLFFRQPSRKHVSSYSTVVVNLEGSSKKVSFEGKTKKEKPTMVITLPVKSEKLATKGTQTDYRESETQTLPWKHGVKAQGKILSELLSLDWFSLEKNFPPGMEEVQLIEKVRQKLAWEEVIEKLRGKKNERKRNLIVLRIAASETAFREKKKEEENKERLELSRRQMKEAAYAFQEKLWTRLRLSYNSQRKENDSKIDYWNHQLRRKIRKMKSASERSACKPDIITMHKDKTSELYAPKTRDGENPSLGHEVIDIQCRYLKRFHGLEILEKHLNKIFHPNLSNPVYDSSKPEKPKICPRRFRERVIEEPKEEKFNGLSLRVPVPSPAPEPATPKITRLRLDSEENLYQAAILLGKIIKGRSIQTQKFMEFYKIEPQ